jgi:HD-like signal output (HDOD) protein
MRLRQLLDSPTLRSMLSSLTSLRTMPTIYAEITAELQSANPSVARVADIVARDPAMTAKILQLINSAYFGLRGNVSDPVRAVQLLGLETVRALVLSTHVYTRFPAPGVMDPGEIWQHSLRTARDAKVIAQRLRLPERDANEAFSAGLLHDVGKLVLAETVGDYEAVVLEARRSGTPLAAAERHAFGAGHPEVAAYLFGLWGLSYGIVEAIAWHHGPRDAGHAAPSTLTAVHVANAVDHTRTLGLDVWRFVDQDYLTQVGVAEDVTGWVPELAAATA